MINTLQIKQAQLKDGYFKIGNGIVNVLIIGSCRVAPYISYLNEFNNQHPAGAPYTIYSLDPFNNNWNEKDERVDYAEALAKLETDERLLNMFDSIDVFFHEYYANAGMFNCSKGAEKNIYQFGLSPALDVCLPNWNDLFILYSDIASFDVEAKKMALQDYNTTGKLSDQTKKHYFEISQRNLNKFCDVCLKSDLPEMKEYVSEQFRNIRFWWTYNHVSKWFTLAVFRLINNKFLKLDLSYEFWEKIKQEDMFANNYTKLSDMDIESYGYQWNEEIVSFKDKIMG